MKTLKSLFPVLTFAIALFMASASQAATPVIWTPYALGSTSVEISVAKEAKTFTLNLSNIRTETVVVRIYDAAGNNLLMDQISNKAAFSKKYNLANLPEGNYFVSISKSLIETIQPIVITETGIEADEANRIEKFRPSFQRNDNKLDINLLMGGVGDVKVKFLNEKGDEIFVDETKGVHNFSKRFNLANIGSGRFTVLVETHKDLFSYKLVVE